MDDESNQRSIREAFCIEDYEPIPDDIGGAWVTRPDSVTCEHCNTTYEVDTHDD